MSDGVFPAGRRARANRYRQDDENFGGSGHFDQNTQFGGGTRFEHGEVYGWGRTATATATARNDWNTPGSDWNAQGYGASGHAADDHAANQDWNADGESWEDRAEGWAVGSETWQGDESGWQGETWNGNGETWNEGAAWNSGDAWDSPADPEPSDEYQPVYTFRTASGEPLEFSRDGARVDSGSRESAPAAAEPLSRAARNRRRSGGAHRLPAPPAALKGRAAVVAVAAGAVVAAGQTGMDASAPATGEIEAVGQMTELAAQSVSLTGDAVTGGSESPQVLSVSAPADLSQFNDILAKGQQFAADLAEQEAAKLRPLFTRFANGNFTSGFGARWGVQHLGIDVAAPIGTPIYAVADGTVIEAGPASGFGMWVRLLHDDGTVTIYGHIDTATVSQGERVMAGDQIATVGNRGFSTGPHCHFEVWLNGVDKVDPVPWLASRGISLGPQRD
ncbi:M23 family metallopeptidase [Nocardia sp. NPDC050406]|uniref:M23 family metallopeptidase n=1 Tax=Nocardia sp. NPDC050406 TaxID=3364318 RepID=UPI0037BD3899